MGADQRRGEPSFLARELGRMVYAKHPKEIAAIAERWAHEVGKLEALVDRVFARLEEGERGGFLGADPIAALDMVRRFRAGTFDPSVSLRVIDHKLPNADAGVDSKALVSRGRARAEGKPLGTGATDASHGGSGGSALQPGAPRPPPQPEHPDVGRFRTMLIFAAGAAEGAAEALAVTPPTMVGKRLRELSRIILAVLYEGAPAPPAAPLHEHDFRVAEQATIFRCRVDGCTAHHIGVACAECNHDWLPEDVTEHEGEHYCAECLTTVLAEERAALPTLPAEVPSC